MARHRSFLADYLGHSNTTNPFTNDFDVKTRQDLLLTVHRIQLETKLEGAGCTATAIGHHAILTATHCLLSTYKIKIDDENATIAGILDDEHDHSIILLKGIRFLYIASFAGQDVNRGDKVYSFGNPGELREQYREGYVTGYTKDNDGSNDLKALILFDMLIAPGDSGSPVFNNDNKIVGVLSIGDKSSHGFILSGMYPLKFSESQLRKAREW